MCHDSFLHVTWPMQNLSVDLVLEEKKPKWLFKQVRVSWFIHTCDMTRSYVCHDSLLCVWYDSCMFVTWHDFFCVSSPNGSSNR